MPEAVCYICQEEKRYRFLHKKLFISRMLPFFRRHCIRKRNTEKVMCSTLNYQWKSDEVWDRCCHRETIFSNAVFTTSDLLNTEYINFLRTPSSWAYSLFIYHSVTGFLSKQEFAQSFPHDETCLKLAFTFRFFSADFSTEYFSCPNFFYVCL